MTLLHAAHGMPHLHDHDLATIGAFFAVAVVVNVYLYLRGGAK